MRVRRARLIWHYVDEGQVTINKSADYFSIY